MGLVELSVVEQRFRAVLQVLAGVPVIEVAADVGVSRQSVHAWVKRYRAEGLAGLADRSKRPVSSQGRMSAEVEAVIPLPVLLQGDTRIHALWWIQLS